MAMQIPAPQGEQPDATTHGMAVLAGGCFWCTEAVYLALEGVTRVVSGYTGGARETANYRAVCSGTTGHAEAVQIYFDPARLSFGRLLQVFFAVAHDPTQRNRQGNDVGTQYRSAIFAVNAAQRQMANDYIAELNATGLFGQPIVTKVTILENFYSAEDYHQDYARRNPDQPYICAVALPKVEKLRHTFPQYLQTKES